MGNTVKCPVCGEGNVTKGINTCDNPACGKNFSKIDMAKILKGTYKVAGEEPSISANDSLNQSSTEQKTEVKVPKTNNTKDGSAKNKENNKTEQSPTDTSRDSSNKKLTKREILNANTRKGVAPVSASVNNFSAENQDDKTTKEISNPVESKRPTIVANERFTRNVFQKKIFTSITAPTSQIADIKPLNNEEAENKECISQEASNLETRNVNDTNEIKSSKETHEEEIDLNDITLSSHNISLENESQTDEVEIEDVEDSVTSEDSIEEDSDEDTKCDENIVKVFLRKAFVEGFISNNSESEDNDTKNDKLSPLSYIKGFFKKKNSTKDESSVEQYDFNADGYYDDTKLADNSEPIYFSKKKAIEIIGYFAMFIFATIWLIYFTT